MGFLTKQGRVAFAALELDRARTNKVEERLRWTIRRACEELSMHVPKGFSPEGLREHCPRRVAELTRVEVGLLQAWDGLDTESVSEDEFRNLLRAWYYLHRRAFGAYLSEAKVAA